MVVAIMASKASSIENKFLLISTILNLTAMMFFGGGPIGAGLLSSIIFFFGITNLSIVIAVGGYRRFSDLPLSMGLMCAAVIAYPLIQLVPVPVSVWETLPGRDLEIRVLHSIGMPDHWRTITNAPLDTLFYVMMLLPLAGVYLSSIKLNDQENIVIMATMLALVVLGVFIGAIQVASGGNVLRLYESQHPRALLGYFPNRNHMAALCAIGVLLTTGLYRLLAPRVPLFVVIGVFALLAGASLGTGSRMGVALTLLSIILSILPLISARFKRSRLLLIGGLTLGLTIIAGLIVTYSGVADRTVARYERLTNDRRPVIWNVSQDVAAAYMPWGAGIGTFVNTYKKFEPIEALAPTYANHAHQDYLEAVIEGGVLAIGVIFMVITIWLVFTIRTLRRVLSGTVSRSDRKAVVLALTGAAIILLPLIHSLVDYPLRRMAIMGLFVLSFAWLARPFFRNPSRLDLAEQVAHVPL